MMSSRAATAVPARRFTGKVVQEITPQTVILSVAMEPSPPGGVHLPHPRQTAVHLASPCAATGWERIVLFRAPGTLNWQGVGGHHVRRLSAYPLALQRSTA